MVFGLSGMRCPGVNFEFQCLNFGNFGTGRAVSSTRVWSSQDARNAVKSARWTS